MSKTKIILIIVGVVIVVPIIIIAILAGTVLMAINPSEQRERAALVSAQSNIKAFDRGLAVAQIEVGEDVLACNQLDPTQMEIKPRSANSCIVSWGSQSEAYIYSFNKSTKCAIISTTDTIGTSKKYLYIKDQVPVAAAPIESDKIEECK